MADRRSSSHEVSGATKRRKTTDADLPKDSGLQIFNEDGSPNLFSLHQGDLGENILSYASGADMCAIDSLNKQFRALTVGFWDTVTNERFGMKNGKEGWKMGTALLRKPVYIYIDMAPGYDDMYYAGSPRVTTHNSLIAVNTDDIGSCGAPEGAGLYNAQDLSYIGTQVGRGWQTTMAGPDGDEIFISNCSNYLDFRTDQIFHRRHFPNNRNGDGIPMIGSKSHFIAVTGNAVNLYRVASSPNELVSLCQSLLLGRGCQNDDEHYKNAIQWGSNQSEFVVYHCLENWNEGIPGTYEISVWSLDAESDNLTQTQTIQADKLTKVALAEDFIVGASVDKKIHVWDRHTTEKKPFVLCDVEEDDELEEDDIIYPLSLSIHGHMLVSTSHIGCALCVWNIKTGQLLKRYNDADDERRVDMLPDGIDATSMSYLKDLNGFICTTGFLNIWTFPTNQSQKNMALSVQRREQDLREAAGYS